MQKIDGIKQGKCFFDITNIKAHIEWKILESTLN